MKNAFFIGDSITLGYTPKVVEKLEGKVKIWTTLSDMGNHETENARWTGYTLNNLARHKWLKHIPEKFDVIHWNNGIWDTVIRHVEDGCFTSKDEYRNNLKKIARELLKLSDNVVFATTIPPRTDNFIDRENGFDFIDRYHEDTIEYNNIAKEVLPDLGIEIEDMYSLVLPQRDVLLSEKDNTHLTALGVETCAELVTNTITKIIER